MLLQHTDIVPVAEETPAPILQSLLKAADHVLAKSKARTLCPYGSDMEPRYSPSFDPLDVRLCA